MNQQKLVKQFLKALETGRMDLETLKQSAIDVLETKGWNNTEIEKRAEAAAEAYKAYLREHPSQETATPDGERAILDFQGYRGKEVIRPGN